MSTAPRALVIDCHGHFTTAPEAVSVFRERQLAGRTKPGDGDRVRDSITDDELRASVEPNQLRILEERGGDVILFSPQASAMGHHDPDPLRAREWAQLNNDLIARLSALYPGRIVPVCQLPQTPAGPIEPVVEELRRCVEELGFVGCNVNPDPSGGYWTGPPIADDWWAPLFEAMVDLRVPGMIHVSGARNPQFHTTGSHYLNADTAVFMQLLRDDLFERHPDLTLVIPHGGGAVPFHWGRFEGLAVRMGVRSPRELLQNLWFDTCVYHQPGMDLLVRVIGPDNLLFASEMLGAVRGRNPDTDSEWDDTKAYLDRTALPTEDARKVFETNARAVYPRLDELLDSRASRD